MSTTTQAELERHAAEKHRAELVGAARRALEEQQRQGGKHAQEDLQRLLLAALSAVCVLEGEEPSEAQQLVTQALRQAWELATSGTVEVKFI